MLLKDAVHVSTFHKLVPTLTFFVIFCILKMLGLNMKAIFRHKLQITQGDWEVYIYIREG